MPLMIKKRKKKTGNETDIDLYLLWLKMTSYFFNFSWHTDLCFETYHLVHLKAKVCTQDQMTEGLKLIMISMECIDK